MSLFCVARKGHRRPDALRLDVPRAGVGRGMSCGAREWFRVSCGESWQVLGPLACMVLCDPRRGPGAACVSCDGLSPPAFCPCVTSCHLSRVMSSCPLCLVVPYHLSSLISCVPPRVSTPRVMICFIWCPLSPRVASCRLLSCWLRPCVVVLRA